MKCRVGIWTRLWVFAMGAVFWSSQNSCSWNLLSPEARLRALNDANALAWPDSTWWCPAALAAACLIGVVVFKQKEN